MTYHMTDLKHLRYSRLRAAVRAINKFYTQVLEP